MKTFLRKTIIFLLILLGFVFVGFILPGTPRESQSLLFAEVQKDSLLNDEISPRLVLVGGSNLSFGINSQLIRDSLKMNPINTAINADIGLKYMMDNTIHYIKRGDIVLLIPEYEQFYGNTAYGAEELLRTVMDVHPSNIHHLTTRQWLNILPLLPKVCFSKFKPSEYMPSKENEIYGVHSFNRYGDTYRHWTKSRQPFSPNGKFSGKFNQQVINDISEFQNAITSKGAQLLITFPCYQDISYGNAAFQIDLVKEKLKNKDFNVIGTPEEFMMPDSEMFNTPYHLIKQGVDERTMRLIRDLKSSGLTGS